jgi:hypothetical protein
MAATAQQLLNDIHNAIAIHEVGDIDSYDSNTTSINDNNAMFEMIKSVDIRIPGHRGPGGIIPQGHFQYEVRVTRRWIPFDD